MSPKCRVAGSITCGSGWMLPSSESFPTDSPCGALIGLCKVNVVFWGCHNVKVLYSSGNRKRKTASVCLVGQVFLFFRKSCSAAFTEDSCSTTDKIKQKYSNASFMRHLKGQLVVSPRLELETHKNSTSC